MIKDALIQLGLTDEQAVGVLGLHTEVLQGYIPIEELTEFKKSAKINEELLKLRAKNTKAVKALLDLTQISNDGDGLTGFAEQIESIIASDSYLFESKAIDPESENDPTPPVLSGREPNHSGSTLSNGDIKGNPFKKESWNLTKQMQIMREDPALYKRLKNAAGLKD